MRTCAADDDFVSTNFTFAVLFHAFMWARIFFFSAVGGLSIKLTVRETPFGPQYFVVTTAIRSGVGTKPGITIANRSTGAWFRGLISTAFFAAAISFSRGSLFGEQTIRSLMGSPL